MPLRIKLKTFKMAGEDQQLEEIIDSAKASKNGETILFPEYGAYTAQGSKIATKELRRVASAEGVTLITTLNLPSEDLPNADPNGNYNSLFIFSRNGQVYSPQAKITPQSFEMRHHDKKYPKINVTPYDFLNRVILKQNGKEYSSFFLICSDLYVLQLFNYHQLKSDAILCPANFGNGAEHSAGGLINYAVRANLFKQGFLCNTYQEARNGRVPLTIGVEKSFKSAKTKLSYRKREMVRMVRKSSAIYPDDIEGQFDNFNSMLPLTQNGTFTVPKSRSLENGLNVKIGNYEKVIQLS